MTALLLVNVITLLSVLEALFLIGYLCKDFVKLILSKVFIIVFTFLLNEQSLHIVVLSWLLCSSVNHFDVTVLCDTPFAREDFLEFGKVLTVLIS